MWENESNKGMDSSIEDCLENDMYVNLQKLDLALESSKCQIPMRCSRILILVFLTVIFSSLICLNIILLKEHFETGRKIDRIGVILLLKI